MVGILAFGKRRPLHRTLYASKNWIVARLQMKLYHRATAQVAAGRGSLRLCTKRSAQGRRDLLQRVDERLPLGSGLGPL